MTTEQFTGMELTPEQERRYILDMVGPDRYIIVVPKHLHDAIMEKHQFKDEDVPGLVVPLFGEIGHLDGMIIRRMTFPPLLLHPPPRPLQKPLPYPPRLRGRYAR